MGINNKAFDKLIFIEKDHNQCHELEKLRTCLKSTICRVCTAHQPLKAPEGRKACRNTEPPRTKPQRGEMYLASKYKNVQKTFQMTKKWLCCRLFKQALKQAHSDRDIQIENSDANDYLKNLRQDWSHCRGVLFLDSFATQVQWSTIETIARFNALDTWILFTTFVVARMLPRSKKPDGIRKGWVNRLTRVYGDESWRELYKQPEQMNLFGDVEKVRDYGVD